MTDLTNAQILDLVKARSDAKIAEARPHIDALITILTPDDSILQHSPIGGAARSVHNTATTFARIADQLAAADAPDAEVDPALAPQA